MQRIIFFSVLGFSIIIIVIGVIMFFTNFFGQYSITSTDWANFSNCFNPFLSFCSLLVLGAISYLTYKTTDRYNRLQSEPLLFLSVMEPVLFTNLYKDSWHVINGSSAPALNLYVRYYKSRNDAPSKWVASSSLKGEGSKELFWIHWADVIEVVYTDVTEDKYYL